jgi:predicted  nucleic acid-binding Zn-ribbon protein
MEAELERFHKNNTQLELNINEIKQKWKATEKELQKERQAVRIYLFIWQQSIRILFVG